MVILIVRDSKGEEIGRLELKADQNILDQCADADIDIPYSCHAGACTSCAVEILSGQEFMDEELDGDKYVPTDEKVCLSCIAGPKKEAVEDKKEHIIDIKILML